MDQKKNQGAGPDVHRQSQPQHDEQHEDRNRSRSHDTDRGTQGGQTGEGTPAPRPEQQHPAREGQHDRGTGGTPERNQGGISNRGVSREAEEQGDLPDRGTERPER